MRLHSECSKLLVINGKLIYAWKFSSAWDFQLNENLHKLKWKLVELNFFFDMLVSWGKLHNKQLQCHAASYVEVILIVLEDWTILQTHLWSLPLSSHQWTGTFLFRQRLRSHHEWKFHKKPFSPVLNHLQNGFRARRSYLPLGAPRTENMLGINETLKMSLSEDG